MRSGLLGANATPMRPRLGSAVRPVGGPKSLNAAGEVLLAVAACEIVNVVAFTAVINVLAGMPVAEMWWPTWNAPDVVTRLLIVVEPLVSVPVPVARSGWS